MSAKELSHVEDSTPRDIQKESERAVVPAHIAIIMDGNGRWAKSRSLGRLAGHKAGAKTVRTIVEESRKLGVRYLTLYAFSSENWGRPEDEVRGLMSLLIEHLRSELTTLTKNGIRLRAIGDMTRLPEKVASVLTDVMKKTESHNDMDLILALSYGGRDEIVDATRKIAEKVVLGQLDPGSICADTIRQHLYAPDVPDPELLIRTSNEFRISNFLLWQIAYSELVITKVAWPEFGAEDFKACLKEFAGRIRRFGLTDEQIIQGDL